MPMYKTIAMYTERATLLWANNTHETHKYKAGEGMPCYSQLIN